MIPELLRYDSLYHYFSSTSKSKSRVLTMANLQQKWLCLSHYFDDHGGEQRDIQEPAA